MNESTGTEVSNIAITIISCPPSSFLIHQMLTDAAVLPLAWLYPSSITGWHHICPSQWKGWMSCLTQFGCSKSRFSKLLGEVLLHCRSVTVCTSASSRSYGDVWGSGGKTISLHAYSDSHDWLKTAPVTQSGRLISELERMWKRAVVA
jgi:hypothetical protein